MADNAFCAKTLSVELSTRWRRVYCFLLGVQRFQGELQAQQVNSVLTVCVCVVSRVSSLSVSVRRPACPHYLCLCTEVPGRAAGPAGELCPHRLCLCGVPRVLTVCVCEASRVSSLSVSVYRGSRVSCRPSR